MDRADDMERLVVHSNSRIKKLDRGEREIDSGMGKKGRGSGGERAKEEREREGRVEVKKGKLKRESPSDKAQIDWISQSKSNQVNSGLHASL